MRACHPYERVVSQHFNAHSSLVYVLEGKSYQGLIRIRVGLFTPNLVAFEYSQINEIIFDVIQQPSVRLTLREEVWITPTVCLVFQDGLECRYLMYQTES